MKKLLQIAGGALLVYIVIVMGIAVIPAIDLSKTPPGPGVKPLTALQAEGSAVYAANGCAYCHTQQVRPLAEDKVFGRPSAPGDFAYQTRYMDRLVPVPGAVPAPPAETAAMPSTAAQVEIGQVAEAAAEAET